MSTKKENQIQHENGTIFSGLKINETNFVTTGSLCINTLSAAHLVTINTVNMHS